MIELSTLQSHPKDYLLNLAAQLVYSISTLNWRQFELNKG